MVEEFDARSRWDRIVDVKDDDLGREARDDGDELVDGAEDAADAVWGEVCVSLGFGVWGVERESVPQVAGVDI